MKTGIQTYNLIVTKVQFFIKQLHLTLRKSTGRPLAINPADTIALSLWKQSNGIPTKKAIWKIFSLPSSYKTLVVNMRRLTFPALMILHAILWGNQKHAHTI